MLTQELISRGWRALQSRKLALIVLAQLALMIVLATTIPQPDRVGPEEYRQWREANPFLGHYAEFLGLTRLFSTWWFYIVVAVFYINTLACTITQVQKGYRLFEERPHFPRVGNLLPIGQAFEVEVGLTLEPAIQAVQEVLKANGFQTRSLYDYFPVKETEDERFFEEDEELDDDGSLPLERSEEESWERSVVRLYAEKGKWGVLCSPLLHLGLTMTLTAVLLSTLTQFSGFVESGEGQVFSEAKDSYHQQSTGPLFRNGHAGFNVRVDRIEVGEPVGAGPAAEIPIKSMITILDGGKEVLKGILEVNNSLEYRGVRLFQNRNFGPGPIFQLKVAGGNASQGMVNLASAGGDRYTSTLLLPGTAYTAYFEQIALDGPLIVTVTYRGNTLFSGELPPGKTLLLDEAVSLTMVDKRIWTSFRLVNDKSELLLYAGFFITCLGLALGWLYTRRQVWAEIEDQGESCRVIWAYNTTKSKSLLFGESERIKSALARIAGSKMREVSWVK